MEQLSPAEQQALGVAQVAITSQRAEQLLRVMNWINGGCLTERQCPFPDITEEERQVIRRLWDSIPSGSSCWMTALYRLVNSRPRSTT